jgi:hypothetical protein
LFYVNPNYFGFSASANLILSSFNENCSLNVSSLGCFLQSGDYALSAYYFDDVRPYMNIACLMLMTGIFLICATFSNWFRHSYFLKKIKLNLWKYKLKRTNQEPSQDTNDDYSGEDMLGVSDDDYTVFVPGQLQEEELHESLQTSQNEVKQQVKKFDDMSPEEKKAHLREISLKLKDQDTRVADVFSEYLARAGRRISLHSTNEIALRAGYRWHRKASNRQLQQQRPLEEQQSSLTQISELSHGELNEVGSLSDQHRLEPLERHNKLPPITTGMRRQFTVTDHDYTTPV